MDGRGARGCYYRWCEETCRRLQVAGCQCQCAGGRITLVLAGASFCRADGTPGSETDPVLALEHLHSGYTTAKGAVLCRRVHSTCLPDYLHEKDAPWLSLCARPSRLSCILV